MKFLLLVLLESVLLIYFSLLPGGVVPSTGIEAPRTGDLEHLLLYIVYGFILAGAANKFGRKGAVLAIVFGSLFGLLNETIQLAVPGRIFDPLDWLTDTKGVLAGVALFHLVKLSRKVRSASS